MDVQIREASRRCIYVCIHDESFGHESRVWGLVLKIPFRRGPLTIEEAQLISRDRSDLLQKVKKSKPGQNNSGTITKPLEVHAEEKTHKPFESPSSSLRFGFSFFSLLRNKKVLPLRKSATMAGVSPPIWTDAKTKVDEKVDYPNLPCPVTYEEIHREAFMSLKPELFEGFRADFNKMMNQKFFFSHSLLMGPTEIPTRSQEIMKTPTANYEFGANFYDPKFMLMGRITMDGKLNARAKCDLTDNFSVKTNAQLTSEPHMSQGLFCFDYKGSDYRTQVQLGNGSLFSANYIQHVTPHLSLGGEVFWIGQHRRSGVGYAARYETDKMIASGQVASTGMAIMNYVQKVTEKVSLATDFMYNIVSRDVTASVGYDYILRQCRVRGKIDSNGVTSAFVEEQLSMGLRILLSAEVDHVKKDYKFGFGVNVG